MTSRKGVCQLTREHGSFVDAHLIPNALTKAGRKRGEKFFEKGPDAEREKNVSSSWYDPRLVTKAGEEILAFYDNWGIHELRRAGLVWSSASHSNLKIDEGSEGSHIGIAKVRINHPKRLRLFLLSLLWRAAATTLPAFDKIELCASDLERLRALLVDKYVGEDSEFPVILWSLLGPGAEHNHTPIFQRAEDFGAEIPANYFRFYLDGLLILFGGRRAPERIWSTVKPFWSGDSKEVGVFAQPFEFSRQKRDLYDVMFGVGWRAA